jgi:uncharacterized SAM-binding protein YcdF (DUF218 family)
MLFAVYLLILLGFWLFLDPEAFPGNKELKSFLMKKLVKFEPVPATFQDSLSDSKNVIYVLGGSPQSLESRFKTASELYKKGLAQKILVDSENMKMEYSPLKKRNLTFNEWAIEKLAVLGVNEKDIEPVFIEKGFFGTYSEAQSISATLLKRDYKVLVLVSSQEHTMRVWESFSKFIKDPNIKLYIYTSVDNSGIRTLVQEYFKLQVYRTFLL